MKKLISNYTFNAATRQIIFADYTSIDLERLLLITNVTDNIIIYNFADPATGAGISGNTVTLLYDTTTMSNTDSLQIYYDDEGTAASEDSLVALNDMVSYLKKVVNQTKVLATQDTLQRQRVAVETMPAVAISGTATVAGTVSVSQPAYTELVARQELSRLEFVKGIRANLIF